MANVGKVKKGVHGSGTVVGQSGIFSPKGGIDPDAQIYFGSVAAAGGSLNDTQKDAWDTFVKTGKSEGWYSKWHFLYPYMGGTIGTVFTNAVNPSQYKGTNNNFVNADADSVCGIDGDGLTKSFNTNFVPSTNLANDSWSIFTIMSTASTGTNSWQGARSDSSNNYMILSDILGSNEVRIRANDSIITDDMDALVADELLLASRTSSTSQKLFKDGVEVGETTTAISASSLPTIELGGMAYYNNSSSSPSIFVSGVSVGYGVGDGLTDTEAANFTTAYKTFLTDISVI